MNMTLAEKIFNVSLALLIIGIVLGIIVFELSKRFINIDECQALGFNYRFCIVNYPSK